VRLLNSGLRKRAIKFGGIVFHIHHREADRTGCQENDQYLSYALQEKSVYCSQGLSQYFQVLDPAQLFENELSLVANG